MNGLRGFLAQAEPNEVTLTVGGVVVMAVCVVMVLGLTLFCMVRILREKQPAEHHHTPLDIDTQDYDR
jgi:heme/copper-type cytochrome/quinol oxidase subunit 2